MNKTMTFIKKNRVVIAVLFVYMLLISFLVFSIFYEPEQVPTSYYSQFSGNVDLPQMYEWNGEFYPFDPAEIQKQVAEGTYTGDPAMITKLGLDK